jgi:hypothetical protein
MRKLFTTLVLLCFLGAAVAADDTLEISGLKTKVPAGWKKVEIKDTTFRLYQFSLPKAEGDETDAEFVVFKLGAGSGTVQQNLDRQRANFKPAKDGDKLKEEVTKVKIGKDEATYLDIQGTFLDKFPPFDPKAKITERENYRRLYVVMPDGEYYLRVNGPAKTVAKHKAAFDEMLKNLK